MKVQDIMTKGAAYLPISTTIREAALKMRELDCGFLPIGDDGNQKLKGVVSDRDLAIRALADGIDPETPVENIVTDKVLYCYQDDDVQTAAESMHDQAIYRIVVLDNESDKQLAGVVSFGDLVRHDEEKQLIRAAKGIWG